MTPRLAEGFTFPGHFPLQGTGHASNPIQLAHLIVASGFISSNQIGVGFLTLGNAIDRRNRLFCHS
jgi:hypothetical protein